MPDPSGKLALVAFGGNLSLGGLPPAALIRNAFSAICEAGLGFGRLSRLYATPCFPAGAGPDYVNAAAVIPFDADLDPAAILDRLHAVEARFGRERLMRWSARTVDVDLIAWGDSVLPDRETQAFWRNLPLAEQQRRTPDRLILPHPRMQDRAFVLVPLQDLAPDWRHPILGLTVTEMLAALPAADREAVRPLPE